VIPYARLIAYAGVVLFLIGIGAFAMHHWDAGSYARLNTKYTSALDLLKEKDALSKQALAQRAADAKEINAHNAQVIKDLHDANNQLGTRLSLANRLLQLAASSGNSVPQGTDKPGTAATSTESGAQQVAGACAALADEAARNANQLDALISEVKGQ